MMETTILFQGKEYLLIGDLEVGGAIATKEAYEAGRVSYAHLFPNGTIKRYNKIIGHRNDITVTGQTAVNVGLDSFFGILTDKSWTHRKA